MHYLIAPLVIVICLFPSREIVERGWTVHAIDTIFVSIMASGATSLTLWLMQK